MMLYIDEDEDLQDSQVINMDVVGGPRECHICNKEFPQEKMIQSTKDGEIWFCEKHKNHVYEFDADHTYKQLGANHKGGKK